MLFAQRNNIDEHSNSGTCKIAKFICLESPRWSCSIWSICGWRKPSSAARRRHSWPMCLEIFTSTTSVKSSVVNSPTAHHTKLNVFMLVHHVCIMITRNYESSPTFHRTIFIRSLDIRCYYSWQRSRLVVTCIFNVVFCNSFCCENETEILDCWLLAYNEPGADPEIGHAGLNFGRFFRTKIAKIYNHAESTKYLTTLC